jgi:hypothetical protein
MASRWKDRKLISTIEPEVYRKDRSGFLRGLRAISRAASQGLDTRGAYLIVENDRVVGIGGCRPAIRG